MRIPIMLEADIRNVKNSGYIILPKGDYTVEATDPDVVMNLYVGGIIHTSISDGFKFSLQDENSHPCRISITDSKHVHKFTAHIVRSNNDLSAYAKG